MAGHHCAEREPSGFCWLNNVHIAIAHAAKEHGLTHAAILDFDVAQPPTPPGLVPEVAPYTVLLDAISKSMAASGLRVGWSFAAPAITAFEGDR